MIPPRRLSAESFGNGVSYRVAVCRKRLRVGRLSLRFQSNPDGATPVARFDGYSLSSPITEVVVAATGEAGSVAQEKAEDR